MTSLLRCCSMNCVSDVLFIDLRIGVGLELDESDDEQSDSKQQRNYNEVQEREFAVATVVCDQLLSRQRLLALARGQRRYRRRSGRWQWHRRQIAPRCRNTWHGGRTCSRLQFIKTNSIDNLWSKKDGAKEFQSISTKIDKHEIDRLVMFLFHVRNAYPQHAMHPIRHKKVFYHKLILHQFKSK